MQSYAVESILEGADMTNAVVDRVDFSKAKLKGAKFVNAVVTGDTVYINYQCISPQAERGDQLCLATISPWLQQPVPCRQSKCCC